MSVLAWVLWLPGCEEPKKDADETVAPAEGKPPVEVVVRSVSVQRTVEGKDKDQSWSALEGKVFVVVTTDVAHNSCDEGDKIDSKEAALKVDGDDKPESVGGGAKAEELCVLCQATDAVSCSGGFARMRPFTFVFQVDEKADVANAKISYRGAEAELGKAKITDRRGNAELEAQIEAKKQQLVKMKKELENTGNKASGEILISEMKALEREIATLEEKLQ